MSILVIFLVVELGWLVGTAYSSHGDPLSRFTMWLTVAGTMLMLSGIMMLAWVLAWAWQRPDFSLWWLTALWVINASLAALWNRRVEELQSA